MSCSTVLFWPVGSRVGVEERQFGVELGNWKERWNSELWNAFGSIQFDRTD